MAAANMAGSMKLFQFIQKSHQLVGIRLSQPNQKQWSINWRNTIFLASTSQMICTTVVYIWLDAKSMFDYGISIFALICLVNNTVNFCIFSCQSENTLKFIENCEKFITQRK